jgi:HlyD family secretion protein
VRSQIQTLNAQADVHRSQLQTAKKDLSRLQALKEDGAATAKQIDDAEGVINTLNKQITAVDVQKQSVLSEIRTMRTRIAQVEDQIQKALIINPVSGTVLTTYAEPFELAAQGRPLYQIANTNELILRVYISGAQLPDVVLGQDVEVLIDKNEDENQSLAGKVSWISSEAEFTPKMIQSKEERVTQMYAVKIRVTNPDGTLKIGMPGEVNFN